MSSKCQVWYITGTCWSTTMFVFAVQSSSTGIKSRQFLQFLWTMSCEWGFRYLIGTKRSSSWTTTGGWNEVPPITFVCVICNRLHLLTGRAYLTIMIDRGPADMGPVSLLGWTSSGADDGWQKDSWWLVEVRVYKYHLDCHLPRCDAENSFLDVCFWSNKGENHVDPIQDALWLLYLTIQIPFTNLPLQFASQVRMPFDGVCMMFF